MIWNEKLTYYKCMAHLDTPFADHMEPLTVTKFKF